jgi:hypothetical protein
MPKYAPRISQEQRAALVNYALQPGSSAKAAQRAAAAGGLDCGPFEISYSRAAELVAEEREHRHGRRARKIASKGAEAAVAEMVGELLNLCERETRQLRNRPSNQPVDTERVRKLARALREVRAAATEGKAGSTGGKGDQAPGKSETPAAEPTLLEQLAGADPSGQAIDAPTGDTEHETHEGTGEESAAHDTTGEGEAEEAAQAVRSSAHDSSRESAGGLVDVLEPV